MSRSLRFILLVPLVIAAFVAASDGARADCFDDCRPQVEPGGYVMGTTNPICCVPDGGGGGTLHYGTCASGSHSVPPAFDCFEDGWHFPNGFGCIPSAVPGDVYRCANGLVDRLDAVFGCNWSTNSCFGSNPNPDTRVLVQSLICDDC